MVRSSSRKAAQRIGVALFFACVAQSDRIVFFVVRFALLCFACCPGGGMIARFSFRFVSFRFVLALCCVSGLALRCSLCRSLLLCLASRCVAGLAVVPVSLAVAVGVSLRSFRSFRGFALLGLLFVSFRLSRCRWSGRER